MKQWILLLAVLYSTSTIQLIAFNQERRMIQILEVEPLSFAENRVVAVGAPNEILADLDRMTISFWMRMDELSNRWQRILSNKPAGHIGEGLEIEFHQPTGSLLVSGKITGAQDKAGFFINSTNVEDPIVPRRRIPPDQLDRAWHHYIVRVTGLEVSLFVNGKLQGKTKLKNPLRLNNHPLVLGGIPAGVDTESIPNLKASLFAVCLVADALSDSQVKAFYDSSLDNVRARSRLQDLPNISAVGAMRLGELGAITRKPTEQEASGMARILDRYRTIIVDSIPPLDSVIALNISSNGLYRDINYNDQSLTQWTPAVHLNRLCYLYAERHRLQAIGHSDLPDLNVLNASLTAFLDINPQSSNWWFNEIGMPQILLDILVLGGEDIPDTLVGRCMQKIGRPLLFGDAFTTFTGQNLVWRSAIEALAACLSHDPDRVARAINELTSTIAVTTAEGVQPDFSFHQHGAQLYSHGYGAGWVAFLSKWLYLTSDTSWEVPVAKCNIVVDTLLKGTQWMMWRTTLDPAALGRNIARPGATLTTPETGYVQSCKLLATAVPWRAEELTEAIARMEGTAPGMTGNKVFWRSDYLTHHRPDWYFSVKMTSNRTCTHETINHENLRGGNLSFGVTLLMRSGNEIVDIFPLWDWARIPGTTAGFNPARSGQSQPQTGSRSFVGGVSDGTRGVAVMEFEYNGLHAKKTWFAFDDGIWCLGADIRGTPPEPTATTVLQEFQRGAIQVNGDILTLAETTVAARTISHDGVLYYFPGQPELTLKQGTRTGTWKTINAAYSDDPVTGEVVQVEIPHQPQISAEQYEYFIHPIGSRLSDPQRADAIAANFKILSNSAEIQAVVDLKNNLLAAAFYSPGYLEFGSFSLKIDQPSVLLLNLVDKSLKISDPSQVHHLLSGSINGQRFELHDSTRPTP